MLQQVFEGLIVNIIKTRQHRVDCCPAAAATLQSQSVRSGIQKVASSLINMAQIFQLRAQRGFNSIVLLCKNVFRLIYHLLQINCGDAAYVYIQNCNISPLQIFRPWSICLTSLKQPHVGRTLGRGIQKGIIFLLWCIAAIVSREKRLPQTSWLIWKMTIKAFSSPLFNYFVDNCTTTMRKKRQCVIKSFETFVALILLS